MVSIDLNPVKYEFSDGGVIYGFPSESMEIVRIVLTFDAGSYFQPQKLVADAASKLFSEGTRSHTPQEVAEFLDYRGIIIEKTKDTYTSDISVYMLRRYADEMLPMLAEMLSQPLFAPQDFEVYRNRERQRIQVQREKTASQAYRLFLQTLYGEGHPLARFADLEDVDALSLDNVRHFFEQYFVRGRGVITLSGGYDKAFVHKCHELFGGMECRTDGLVCCQQPPRPATERVRHLHMDSAQTTLRFGCLLPLRWDDMDFARYLVLNTVLGGYFGSRLMSNLREDKGYTYGVYSSTIVSRDDIKFTASLDVGNEVAEDAVRQFYHEIDRLQQDRVPEEELEMVRRFMEGEFIRAVEGVLERGERFMQLATSGVNEQFTDNYLEAIRATTSDDLLRLAQTCLRREKLIEVVVGAGC